MTTQTAPKTDGLRKAAILVSSLERHAADLVLGQMDPAEARLVRQAMLEMDRIDQEEQERVIEEFCRRGPLAREQFPPGIELDGALARRLARPAAAPATEEPRVPFSTIPPFRFLRDAEAEKLVKILATERPQVIALVLSHLSPEQAGKVLVRLAPALQVDVVRRLVDLEETAPEILREVERGLETRLSEQVRMQRRRVAGLAAVAGILGAAEQRVGMQILENLAAYDRPLADRLCPRRFEFADLLGLDDRTLAAVLDAADAELLVLALVGAPPEWTDRLVQHLPQGEARAIRHRLDHFGPVRLSDVEEARAALAELARQLAIQGRIELPRKPRMKDEG